MRGFAFSICIEHVMLVLSKVIVIRGLPEVDLTYRLAQAHGSKCLAS